MPRPRVFVSSVVEGFGDFRAAARLGVQDAGGDAVLVNEDFPSLSLSPRNACLDAVDSCDVYLGIIGSRGGWTTPSGKLVVEEEYERAKAKRLPTLFFLENTQRDDAAQRFVHGISDYVDGTFRRSFTTPDELRREIARSLAPLIENEVSVVRPPDEMVNAFRSAGRSTHGETTLKTWIAPERSEELVDPVRFGSSELRNALMEIGHSGEVGLLDYRYGKDVGLKRDVLSIEESGPKHNSSRVLLGFTERGMLSSDLVIPGRDESMLGMVVAIEDVEESLRKVMRFYGGLMDYLDPFKRHHRFFYNVGLYDLGHRALERNPRARTSMTIPMRSGGPLIAYDAPRIIGRDDLKAPDSEIDRATTILTRKASDGF